MLEEDITIERDGREEDGMSEVDLEAAESRAESKIGKAKRELEAAREEAKQNLDGWQRAKADYVNALKRFEEEKSRAVEQGLLRAVKALLPAYDALERARAHGEIPDGFEGIAKQLEGAFTALGVTPLGVEGEPFDPMRHEALGSDMTEDQAMDDRVTQVLEKGYAVGASVLRPARVRVAHFQG
jgi:molecular chaperone GrpE